MKILMVSMSSLHFFRWTEQLKEAGHDVYWFDVLDGKNEVGRIDWVNQIVRWRLKYNFPKRYFVKKKIPKLYKFIQRFNENNMAEVFERKLLEIQPDLVHSFAMQMACIPILDVMVKYKKIKWAYSSWGSDIFYYKGLHIDENKFRQAFSRIDFLITDCERDYKMAKAKGFNNIFLGVFPGNGGVDFDETKMEFDITKRNLILIKGYNTGVGRGLNIVRALSEELLPLLKDYEIIIYGADDQIETFVKENIFLKNLKIKVFLKKNAIPNEKLVELMGKTYIHIANSISDGISNSMIEAMGMGAFPIQSNPGNVTSEIVTDNENGFLIENPEDIEEIKNCIKKALLNPAIIQKAFNYNTTVIKGKYQRNKIQPKIEAIYESIYY